MFKVIFVSLRAVGSGVFALGAAHVLKVFLYLLSTPRSFYKTNKFFWYKILLFLLISYTYRVSSKVLELVNDFILKFEFNI